MRAQAKKNTRLYDPLAEFVKYGLFDRGIINRNRNCGYDRAVITKERKIVMILQNKDNVEWICVSGGVRFYTIPDVAEMTKWSIPIVQKLFNDPEFPSADFGKNKIVEEHALIEFFNKHRTKERSRHWRR